ncbi:MAG: HlyD family efflux transporter periplasmic adaptor subunit [Desulfobulbus sp.]|uniref:HlyD family efflux transporter periplasmic adaptor subunit n=1 Tax=Desulfobulbus sp. TaxID=895 RepID=UPI0028419BF5|nr:HlyD family efflux transporter periplasmic adaptor subunit [Desulfobulbus sp.]MDR2550949.1 HlyD family efflux transporter periplasmic adaptor subunit [Desulfobulbus sp.]
MKKSFMPGPGWRGLLTAAGTALLLAATGCSNQPGGNGEAGGLTLYGTVDIREVQLAFQDGGRILGLTVDEGAVVDRGQVVAELDPARFRMEAERLAGEVASQAQQVARLKSGSRPQEIARARAAVASAKANLKDAELVLARKQALRLLNRISQQEVDSALAGMETRQANLKTAEEDLSLAIEGPRREDIAAAEASLAALQAARDLAEQRLADTRLRAPAAGVIRNRILEPGAMASAGAPVLTMALTNPLWVRAYISEPDLGRIREGMGAEIQTDSQPGKRYKGWVGFISSTAEFTPKTVETTELRTKLVYRARIFVCDSGQELRLGMPVTVTVDTKQNQQDKATCGNR